MSNTSNKSKNTNNNMTDLMNAFSELFSLLGYASEHGMDAPAPSSITSRFTPRKQEEKKVEHTKSDEVARALCSLMNTMEKCDDTAEYDATIHNAAIIATAAVALEHHTTWTFNQVLTFFNQLRLLLQSCEQYANAIANNHYTSVAFRYNDATSFLEQVNRIYHQCLRWPESESLVILNKNASPSNCSDAGICSHTAPNKVDKNERPNTVENAKAAPPQATPTGIAEKDAEELATNLDNLTAALEDCLEWLDKTQDVCDKYLK